MKRRDDIWTIIFVTVVAVVIWIWAARNTQQEATVMTHVTFRGPDGAASIVTPNREVVQLSLTGSRGAVEEARAAMAPGLEVVVPASSGEVLLDGLARRIEALDLVRSTGVSIVAAEPASVTVNVKMLASSDAAVRPVLPGVTVSGDITVDPATVTVQLPESVRAALPKSLTVDAVLDRSRLEQLAPGVVHTLDAAVRLPSPLDATGATVTPQRVSVTFKVQSKTTKTTLDQVRVLLAGPPEDYAAFAVSLPQRVLHDVIIEADHELVAEIEAGETTVFAIVRLASRDMEQRIDHKAVAAFMAIREDGSGVHVIARLVDPAMLNIELEITPTASE